MQVTHIGHSGFAVELERTVLVFDYYRGDVPVFPKEKAIYVFSSHAHQDHFNWEIFSLFRDYPHVCFVLSHDIHRKYSEKYFLRQGISREIYGRIRFLKDGTSAEISSENGEETCAVGDAAHTIWVETLRSTDEGVAFMVNVEGRAIYHAGDLNWWTWGEESQQANSAMVAAYKKEIDSIAGRHFDLAFVVLDSRQETDFWRGFDYFMKHTDTELVYPMHYWGDSSVLEKIRQMDCAKSYCHKIRG